MASIMRMPEVLANVTEATVSKWLIKEGDTFTLGQAMAEVETEKALVEVPAETNGILGKYLALEGASVQIGAPIAVLLIAGEGQAEIEKLLGESHVDEVAIAVATTEVTETVDVHEPVVVATPPVKTS